MGHFFIKFTLNGNGTVVSDSHSDSCPKQNIDSLQGSPVQSLYIANIFRLVQWGQVGLWIVNPSRKNGSSHWQCKLIRPRYVSLSRYVWTAPLTYSLSWWFPFSVREPLPGSLTASCDGPASIQHWINSGTIISMKDLSWSAEAKAPPPLGAPPVDVLESIGWL